MLSMGTLDDMICDFREHRLLVYNGCYASDVNVVKNGVKPTQISVAIIMNVRN
jgi:hypothetical protein